MTDRTLNVRCCCIPGLVLGRLPDHGDEYRTWLLRDPARPDTRPGNPAAPPRPAQLFMEVQQAYLCDGRGEPRREFAWNANHADVATLQRIPDFELICNLPPGKESDDEVR